MNQHPTQTRARKIQPSDPGLELESSDGSQKQVCTSLHPQLSGSRQNQCGLGIRIKQDLLNKKAPAFLRVLFIRNNPLAVTYFPTPLQVQYRERYEVSLPCSGWERVGPSCSYHQEKNIKL
jgi:hypothetical protein